MYTYSSLIINFTIAVVNYITKQSTICTHAYSCYRYVLHSHKHQFNSN